MNLIEMDGFLRGKCLPGDMKVNETNAEYLVRKFAAFEQQLAESQREFRAADAIIENLQMRVEKLAAEGAATANRMQRLIQIINNADNDYCMCGDAMKNHTHGGCGHPTGMFDYHYNQWLEASNETPATDAFLAEVRASGVEMLLSSLPPNYTAREDIENFAAQLRQGGAA